MKKRMTAVMAGVCMAAVVAFAGCAPKEIENDYVKITGYKGIEVDNVKKTKVTDADVDTQLENMRQSYATYTDVTDRAVQDGDTVTIDYSGKKDGVAFEGGTAQDQQLEIGSGTFIDGFEEGIIGHKTGESFDLNLTFPDNYRNEELSGQPVVFSVTLKKIQQKNLPEVNDDFVTMVKGEKTTVSEYKKEIKEMLELKAESDYQSAKQSAIEKTLMENVEVKKYPEKKVEEYTEMMKSQYQQIADAMQVEYADVIQQYTGMDEKTFETELDKQIKDVIKRQEALDLIAKEEGVSVSDKDIDQWLKDYAALNQISVEDLKSQNTDEEIKSNVQREETVNWLWDNAKIKKDDK